MSDDEDPDPEHYGHNTGAYWEAHSNKALKRKIRGNMTGSSNHQGAADELARRDSRRQEKLIWVTIVLAAVSIAVTFWTSSR